MRLRACAALAATFLPLLPAAPAHAAPPVVEAKFVFSFNRASPGGWLVAVGCRATVATGANTQVPLWTKVTCSVDDTARTVTALGAAAATQIVLVAPLEPVWACVTAEAVVADAEPNNGRFYPLTAGPDCIRLPNT